MTSSYAQSQLMRSITAVASAATMSLLAGCFAVGPDYVPPSMAVPPQWNSQMQRGLKAEPIDAKALASWWSTLNDPTLTSLIEGAIAGNLDLRQARARIREARARRGAAGAERFPSLDASGSIRRSRGSEQTSTGQTQELYDAAFDASWELDVFGGVRRSVEAKDADLQASEEDLRDILVSLLAEVAVNYVDVRSFQSRIAIAEANLQTQRETYEIVTARFQAGLTTELDLEQARYNMEQTRSQIPTLRIALEQAKNRLAILQGQSPGIVNPVLSDPKPIPVTSIDVAVGVPADILRQRPDIRRAERNIAAETARVGVITAELYPKFTLTGSIGLEALSLQNLLRTGSRTWGIGPSLTWNIFDAGRIQQNIEAQDAVQEQARVRYEATILTALEDVENALFAYANEQLRRQSLLEAAEAAKRAVEIAGVQYISGRVNFQVVLDAQRSLLTLQDQLAQSEAAMTINLVGLYKAIGGGWNSLGP